MSWRWLRNPILHILVIGFALYAVTSFWPRSAPDRPSVQREPIIISAQRIQAMQTGFVQRWGKIPTPQERSALIAQTVEDEMLYREARVLALDFEDASVQRRLIEKMRAVSDRPGQSPDELAHEARELGLDDDVVIRRLLVEKMRILLAQDPTASLPTEAELQDYLERHRDQFEQPAELTFSHVFLSESARGPDLETDALATLEELRQLTPSASAALDLSDPFLLGLRIRAYPQSRVTARFGKSFAEQIFALPGGAWSDPIASPYGLHLIWVEEKSAPRLPALEAVSEQVAEGVEKERAAAQLTRGLARLRGLYEVRIEQQDDPSAPDISAGSQPES